MPSIAEQWNDAVVAMQIPPHVAVAMRPTFIAGFVAALRAMGDLGGLSAQQQEDAVTAWFNEVQSEAADVRRFIN